MTYCIEVKKLTKTYGAVTAVKEVSLQVKKGTVFGLLGANGAGKSTLIECMLGTKQMDTGDVTLLGHDPAKERRKLFERVGVQFQDAHYQENIRVGELCEVTASLYKEPDAYIGLLQRFGIADKKDALVKSLSGGERQRLFIILALCMPVVVLVILGMIYGEPPYDFRGTTHYLYPLCGTLIDKLVRCCNTLFWPAYRR